MTGSRQAEQMKLINNCKHFFPFGRLTSHSGPERKLKRKCKCQAQTQAQAQAQAQSLDKTKHPQMGHNDGLVKTHPEEQIRVILGLHLPAVCWLSHFSSNTTSQGNPESTSGARTPPEPPCIIGRANFCLCRKVPSAIWEQLAARAPPQPKPHVHLGC